MNAESRHTWQRPLIKGHVPIADLLGHLFRQLLRYCGVVRDEERIAPCLSNVGKGGVSDGDAIICACTSSKSAGQSTA
jgi:hypothetical protein